MLTEDELNSAAFDRDGGPPDKRYLICTSPRSGSYLLCRHMIAAGLGVPHEYFNPLNSGPICQRLGIAEGPDWLDAFIKGLETYRTVDGIFGAKLQFWELKDVLHGPAADRLLQASTFIYLQREDLLAQAISYHISRLTGVWVGNAITTPPQEGAFDDFDAIGRQVETLVGEEAGWRRFFAANGIVPLFVSYRDVVRTPGAVVEVIAGRLGIRRPAAEHPYVEAAPDHSGPDRADIYRRYVAAKGRPGMPVTR